MFIQFASLLLENAGMRESLLIYFLDFSAKERLQMFKNYNQYI